MFIRQHKYRAKRALRPGYSFASKLEASLFDLLRASEAAGNIKELKVQPSVYLTDARVLMKPDFSYFNLRTNAYEWAESKGFQTDVYRIKRRLWKFYGPGPLHVYTGSAKRIRFLETIYPQHYKKEHEEE